MATNLGLDDSLILEAVRIGNHKTRKDAVTTALKEYIAQRRQMEIVDLFGKIDMDPNYDYKKGRDRHIQINLYRPA
ncbi:conserved hypothetical protein [Candidatus Desulfarcum epimagneticum]|uniref:Uncharacterized protein n=1 Tax=uncultured Desulfobacteraceae bacterium TaxID=218296 RepID=A0A484HFI9_9BACT|nr:conserved hypothetical protein [uncultured Desulfobacteraceae bacterium]